jgi:hypothetical protein
MGSGGVACIRKHDKHQPRVYETFPLLPACAQPHKHPTKKKARLVGPCGTECQWQIRSVWKKTRRYVRKGEKGKDKHIQQDGGSCSPRTGSRNAVL